MRIVVMSFLSLDGVYQGPGAPDEDRSGGFERGGWQVPFVDAAFEAKAAQWTSTATGFLFGRRTYEAFSSVWPTITDPADRNAALLNTLPKYVVATQEVDASWGPVTVLGEDAMEYLGALKVSGGRLPAEAATPAEAAAREEVIAGEAEFQVHGSGRLARLLLAAGLVDELRLAVAPVVVGQGRRLFGDTDGPVGLELLSQDRTPSGVTMSRFAVAGDARGGTYVRGTTNVAEA